MTTRKATSPPLPPPPTEPTEPAFDLAAAAREIDAGMKKLKASGVKREAIVVLLGWTSGLSRTDVRKVLDAMDTFAADILVKR